MCAGAGDPAAAPTQPMRVPYRAAAPPVPTRRRRAGKRSCWTFSGTRLTAPAPTSAPRRPNMRLAFAMSTRAPGRTACRAEALRCARLGRQLLRRRLVHRRPPDQRLELVRPRARVRVFGPGMLCTRVPAVCGAAAERARAIAGGPRSRRRRTTPSSRSPASRRSTASGERRAAQRVRRARRPELGARRARGPRWLRACTQRAFPDRAVVPFCNSVACCAKWVPRAARTLCPRGCGHVPRCLRVSLRTILPRSITTVALLHPHGLTCRSGTC